VNPFLDHIETGVFTKDQCNVTYSVQKDFDPEDFDPKDFDSKDFDPKDFGL